MIRSIRLLATGDAEERLTATEAIMIEGAEALEEGELPAERLARALEEAEDLAEPLGRVFIQEHLLVRSAAYLCLKGLGPRGGGALPHLVAGIGDPRGEVRAYAIELIGALGAAADPAGEALLEALLDEGREDLRPYLAPILAAMAARQPALAARLRQLERDPSPYVRAGAALVLGAR